MKGILETVASVVERLSLSSAEKKRLKQELETALLENECRGWKCRPVSSGRKPGVTGYSGRGVRC